MRSANNANIHFIMHIQIRNEIVALTHLYGSVSVTNDMSIVALPVCPITWIVGYSLFLGVEWTPIIAPDDRFSHS